MAKLRRDLQALNVRLRGEKTPDVSAPLVLEGSGTVQLSLPGSKAGSQTRVAIIFADDTYPASPVLLLCESSDAINSQLEDLNDSLQDGADLETIVRSICAALSLPNCLTQSPIAPAAADPEAEQDAQGLDIDDASCDASEAEQEESEDDDEAYDVAERDDEDLLKTIYQKISRWEQRETAIIKACLLSCTLCTSMTSLAAWSTQGYHSSCMQLSGHVMTHHFSSPCDAQMSVEQYCSKGHGQMLSLRFQCLIPSSESNAPGKLANFQPSADQ